MATKAVEGVIVIAPSEGRGGASIRSMPRGVPVGGRRGELRRLGPVAAVDQFAGARLATEHLCLAGHPTVWHVAGP
jgi:DNA-binding LacI/PurR family transcriptional regulator